MNRAERFTDDQWSTIYEELLRPTIVTVDGIVVTQKADGWVADDPRLGGKAAWAYDSFEGETWLAPLSPETGRLLSGYLARNIVEAVRLRVEFAESMKARVRGDRAFMNGSSQ